MVTPWVGHFFPGPRPTHHFFRNPTHTQPSGGRGVNLTHPPAHPEPARLKTIEKNFLAGPSATLWKTRRCPSSRTGNMLTEIRRLETVDSSHPLFWLRVSKSYPVTSPATTILCESPQKPGSLRFPEPPPRSCLQDYACHRVRNISKNYDQCSFSGYSCFTKISHCICASGDAGG